MVDSKECNKKSLKELLKNKRTIGGTPLHRYATRYACYIALSFGCTHLTIGYFAYYADVDDFWLKSGSEHLSHKIVDARLHETHDRDTDMKIDDIKHTLKNSLAYDMYSVLSFHFKSFKERYFSSSPLDAASEPSETIKGASSPTGSSLNSSTIKETSQ